MERSNLNILLNEKLSYREIFELVWRVSVTEDGTREPTPIDLCTRESFLEHIEREEARQRKENKLTVMCILLFLIFSYYRIFL